MVGVLNQFGVGDSVQHNMRMEEIDKIQVTPMGGNMVLLRSDIQGEIRRAAEIHHQWWNVYFKEMKMWKPHMVATKRMVWVKIFGLPLHVWEEDTFKQIGAQFGVFLDFDDATINRKRLDVARVKILTDRLGWLNEVVDITVVGVNFRVSVVEEGGPVVVKEGDGGVEWEDRSIEDSAAEEDVVGKVLGERSQSEEEDPTSPSLRKLGAEEENPRLNSPNEQMGQEGEKTADCVEVQQFQSGREEETFCKPTEIEHVAMERVDKGGLEIDEEQVGPVALIDPNSNGEQARHTTGGSRILRSLSPI